jgi:hypothetical protein
MITYKRTRRSAKQIESANRALQKSYKSRGLPLQNKNTNTKVAPTKVQIKRLEESVSAKVKEERQKRYGAT